MARRKYALPAETRAELVAKADELAAKLIAEQGLDKEDAADVIGLVVETLARIVGVPAPAAEAVMLAAENLVERVGEVLKADPDVLMERAIAAMKAGKPKRSKRLMARAERVLARQAGDDDDGGVSDGGR